MALELAEQGLDISSGEIRGTEEFRSEVATEGEPSRVDVLRGVEGMGTGDALTPTFAGVGLDADQQRLTAGLGSVRGAER